MDDNRHTSIINSCKIYNVSVRQPSCLINHCIRTEFEFLFHSGHFTSAIYADECTFEDPTIKFQGRDLYSRNLKLLVPFFDNPSIFLKEIKKGINPKAKYIIASWKLRTHLILPWRPLILIDGTTTYDIDDQLRVIRHVESWKISALEAIGQIFTPGFLRSDKWITYSLANLTVCSTCMLFNMDQDRLSKSALENRLCSAYIIGVSDPSWSITSLPLVLGMSNSSVLFSELKVSNARYCKDIQALHEWPHTR